MSYEELMAKADGKIATIVMAANGANYRSGAGWRPGPMKLVSSNIEWMSPPPTPEGSIWISSNTKSSAGLPFQACC
jgi:hypothetical protein